MAPTLRHWLGIDFSGDHHRWKAARAASTNVWIADVARVDRSLALAALHPVQALPGDATPFRRLATLLGTGSHAAAGIDAPFSIPAQFLGGRSHAELLATVARLAGRPRDFAPGARFVEAVTGRAPPLDPKKPLRVTERDWVSLGVNVRSTLWVSPRGGAPMTAACLTLLHRARRPVWPFATSGTGLLVEAFPAAQLRRWGLPHRGYADARGRAQRDLIVDAVGRRVDLGGLEGVVRASADALDAVLCAFAAIAVTEGRVAIPPSGIAAVEGWIAVHR